MAGVFFHLRQALDSSIIFFDIRFSNQAEVNFVTTLRTKGATTNTVGNAIGQAVANPLNH